MGLFGNKPRLTRAEKLLAKAKKAGVDTTGALAALHRFEDDRHSFLVVYPDRVDVVSKGKIGSLLGAGAGTESYPLGSITSVSTRNQGISCFLMLTGSNFAVSFSSDAQSAPAAKDAIMKAKTAGQS